MKRIMIAACVGLAVSGGETRAQSETLVPFDQFLSQVASAPAPAAGANPQSAQSAPAAFEEGRQHILKLYNGVRVKHSYLVESHPYDCVPIAQQPSVRLRHLTSIASPPPSAPFLSEADPASPSDDSTPVLAQIDPSAKTDSLGNALSCEDGSIPMRRVTLETLSRFKSLHEFFEKGPNGTGHAWAPDPTTPPAAASAHKYAHSYQFVSNVGGSAELSLWNPTIKTNLGEVFSLSQYWFTNNKGTLQTLEQGLQAYPNKYHTNKSVLFVYWTTDNYNNTGCYNLDCAGFVQTNSRYHLGAGFGNYSKIGGAQYKVQLGAYLYQGNWWVYVGGGNTSNAIGYFPGSLYTGQQMSQGANEIDFGGETVGSTVWPPMGSGRFAARGFRQAAYIKNIQYYPAENKSSYATLHVDQPSISCYTDVTHDNTGESSWQTYFFYGGPGGKGC